MDAVVHSNIPKKQKYRSQTNSSPWITNMSRGKSDSEFLVLLHNDKALMDCVWFWYVGSFSVFIAVSLLCSAFEHCETSHVRLVQWNSQKTWCFFRSILQSNQRSVPLVQQTFRDGRTGEAQLCIRMPTKISLGCLSLYDTHPIMLTMSFGCWPSTSYTSG